MGILNLLSTSEFIAGNKKLKEDILMAIEQNTAELKASVEALLDRVNDLVGPLRDANATLAGSFERERAAMQALIEAEDAEDVQQNQELADAKAETEAALRVQDAASAEIMSLKTLIDNALRPEDVAPDAPVEEPAEAEPVTEPEAVETPAEDAEVVTDAPEENNPTVV